MALNAANQPLAYSLTYELAEFSQSATIRIDDNASSRKTIESSRLFTLLDDARNAVSDFRKFSRTMVTKGLLSRVHTFRKNNATRKIERP